ncbi:MAG: UDP-N-acetylmuramoyl-L-alanine--D-glutamate ligase [Oscillospiraceae bacterium]|jgi:UDP-N-acetylmuramoylalanine--D-glutamate ligase|nr:UDP-N-acetylmuramoyl-L-alanine--D-glutamate ligase [Oscillospiraceae bacterium]
MITAYPLDKKRVLVVGMVRSGIAAAKLLLKQGAHPILNDLKERSSLSGLDAIDDARVEWALGQPPDALLDRVDLVVISPAVPIQSDWIEKARAKNVKVIGELELGASYADGPIAAITGTNGKTTTTTLLGDMLSNAGKCVHVVGNIGNPVSGAAADARQGDMFVIEVSSFQMESAPTFRPHVGALLNITPDHLNRHGDMNTYIALKKHMFENQTGADSRVVNADDPLTAALLGGLPGRNMSFSRKMETPLGAFLRGSDIILRQESGERALCAAEEVRIPGAHNLENAMAAACMAATLDVPPPVIRHTLRTFAGVVHRIETVRVLDEVTYINDSKGTNVDSTLRAIDTMRVPTVIILGGYDKHVSFDELAEAVKRSPMMAAVVLIGDTAEQIRAALAKAGYEAVHDAGHDFVKAIETSRSLAKPGWNVLLSPACASFDMFEDYEHRGREFRRIVESL